MKSESSLLISHTSPGEATSKAQMTDPHLDLRDFRNGICVLRGVDIVRFR